VLYQLNNQPNERSMTEANIGGYKMDCHIVADDKMDFRPKKRNKSVGLRRSKKGTSGTEDLEKVTHEAFISPSTIGAERPGGLIAGARAINTLIFSFSPG